MELETWNQIEVSLPRRRVSELYTCRDLLPSWSPGFVSLEVLCEGTATRKPTFRQRYRAMGREIDEVLTLMENDLPRGLCVVADNGGTLTRESRITFEEVDETTTQLIVWNTFTGEAVPHLVRQDLQDYTQAFLKTFKAFAESRED